MQLIHYAPHTWFWIVGNDDARAWSSAVGAYVTQWDVDQVTRIASEAELDEVLRDCGLKPCLVAASDIKMECGRRIYAVASQAAQTNMAAARAAGMLTPEQNDAFEAGLLWIASMQATCRALALSLPDSYADDASWPPCPANVAALAAAF